MTPEIKTLTEKLLVGLNLEMSIADNRTAELWRSLMMRRNEIPNNKDSNLYSLQAYPENFFAPFHPTTRFTKWAAVEVSGAGNIPAGMELLRLSGGLYAVFHYRGHPRNGAQTFQYIYGSWLPHSGYELDNRPHFEILGEKYQNDSPDSEEEIWIPIKPKRP